MVKVDVKKALIKEIMDICPIELDKKKLQVKDEPTLIAILEDFKRIKLSSLENKMKNNKNEN